MKKRRDVQLSREVLLPSRKKASLRVAHVVSELRPGGVEIRLLELMTFLGKEAAQHTVFTVSGRKGSLAPQFEALGVQVVAQKMRSFSYPFAFITNLRAAQVTAVQAYLNHTSGFQMFLSWLAGVPIRITSFRSDGFTPTTLTSKIRRIISRKLIEQFSTSIVGVAPSTLENNLPGWQSDSRCQVVVNGFPVEIDGLGDTDVREEPSQADEDIPLLAHVGRADIPTKNRERALRILAELKRNGNPHRLAFVGRHGATEVQAQDNLRRFQSLAEELGVSDEVEFLGERSDVRRILRRADCLLVTSTLEGLPGVVIESLLEDTPVVATDLPGASFISEELPGVKCIPVELPDRDWALAITDWVEECSGKASKRELSRAVAESQFNIEKQTTCLKKLWNGQDF